MDMNANVIISSERDLNDIIVRFDNKGRECSCISMSTPIYI